VTPALRGPAADALARSCLRHTARSVTMTRRVGALGRVARQQPVQAAAVTRGNGGNGGTVCYKSPTTLAELYPFGVTVA
jgi:hypothetical protein